ncbi:hypothetical protein EH244_15520 [Variovorax beijingensis]|uniref:Uncharacterized protein n=1 Tax=Variovorax beijingensis TaxID=2496117 RepID=A0A3P3EQ06_9BURK|nr:hypothetical protein [Variovorax beijingensis]RRH87468.1 hypothetical protein EH244_15520 [Variovorax beijingensis]
MRVKMRPRYRGGTRLSKREFVDQPWLCGMLTLQTVEGRTQLGLWHASPGDMQPPLGILWRPELVACAFDTISFAGTEQVSGRWCYQVWYCEAYGLPSPLSFELLQVASTMNHEPN